MRKRKGEASHPHSAVQTSISYGINANKLIQKISIHCIDKGTRELIVVRVMHCYFALYSRFGCVPSTENKLFYRENQKAKPLQ